MNSFDDNFDQRLQLTHNLVRNLCVLGEFKGREEMFSDQMPQALETLKEAAIIQSTESSNRIEGVTATPQKIRDLVDYKTTPKNRPEQEIAGYRDVLNTIHANYGAMQLSTNLLLQLHRDLFKYTSREGGAWKSSPNSITEEYPDGTKHVRFETVAPHLVGDAMDKLNTQFNLFKSEEKVDQLLLIPAYILDFLCIHPFHDGNGRMARLLTLLLLYQAGYSVGRFISLEKIMEQSKDGYYESLNQCSQGWHEGKHTLIPWTEYMLGIEIAAYRDFENRMGSMNTPRGSKSDLVLNSIKNFHGAFTVRELQDQCPNVGIDLIRRILRNERQKGRVECSGRGPSSTWRNI